MPLGPVREYVIICSLLIELNHSQINRLCNLSECIEHPGKIRHESNLGLVEFITIRVIGIQIIDLISSISDKVLQTMKTDMVKHDVEVESSEESADEIDKLTEHEADQHWYMQVFAHLTSEQIASIHHEEFNLLPKIFLLYGVDSQEHKFQLEGLGE
ncbi:hypothetical protein Tco_0925632 [Tanacetum coccineum]|uniref:Uncharacterized protein n=1 Tax=Tanacetum coccineum TaxID=301880 RepID=A0ABQ5D892_9ASTR